MPTLRRPVSGWWVKTTGRVMKGPPSSGQQVRTGILVRSTSSPREDHLLAGGPAHLFGEHAAQAGQLGEQLQLLHQGVGFRLHEAQELRGDVVQGLHLQGQAHALHGAEGVHQHRHVVARDILEQQGRPAALADPVGDLGDLKIRAHRLLDAHQFPGLLQPCDKILQIPISHVISLRGSCQRSATQQSARHGFMDPSPPIPEAPSPLLKPAAGLPALSWQGGCPGSHHRSRDGGEGRAGGITHPPLR